MTVAPRDLRHPISSSADTIHFVRSHGNAIIDNLTVKLEQDDAINVHDRFTVAKKTAPRTLQVVLERGARYFRPGSGNDIELHDPGYNATGWKGKCVGIDGETILVDRDLPASNPEEGYFLVFDRTASSDGVIIRNCTFEDMEMRTLVNASNATVENCVFRNLSSLGVELRQADATDVVGNVFENCPHGTLFSLSKDCRLIGNSYDRCQPYRTAMEGKNKTMTKPLVINE